MKKTRLGVNIDHVATLRQLRAGLVDYPDIIEASHIVRDSGADQLTVHLRGDRRHIQVEDIIKLTEEKILPLNLEMAATSEMVEMALRFKPSIVCIVPEKREEITTEGGLDVIGNQKMVSSTIKVLKNAGIRVSLFIEPSIPQVEKSHELGCDAVEFHTGRYALAKSTASTEAELMALRKSFTRAHELNVKVHAGHGLDYKNTAAILDLDYLEEVNIGHSIVCRAVIVGLAQAVSEMKKITERNTHDPRRR